MEVNKNGIIYMVENKIIIGVKTPIKIENAKNAIDNIGKNINDI